jgi:stage IV sporulation protein FB
MEYPLKPQPVPAKNTLVKSILSMVAFFAVYYFVFDKNLLHALNLVIVLFIHEAGHFLAMKFFGYKDVKMFFVPFMGAYVVGEKENIPQKQSVMVILAGPIPGIIIGIFLISFAIFFNLTTLSNIINMFIFINVFNLIPVTPMDGGRLLEVLFVGARETLLLIFMILSILLIICFSIYSESYGILLLVVFLVMRINLQRKTKEIRKDLASKNINFAKSYSELSDEEYYLIKGSLITKMPELKKNYSEENKYIDLVKNILQPPAVEELLPIWKFIIVITWLVFLILVPLGYLVLNALGRN